jgi:MtaA/CmuA family methyltransferase
VDELLERCVQIGIAFARAQVEAGAHIIGLGDAIASQVSPAMYRRFALPFERRIFDAVHEAGALGRLHICGDTARIVGAMAESGADIVDLDWMVDLDAARGHYGDTGPAVCGNFDPVAVFFSGSPRTVREAVLRCLEVGGPRCISAAGCEVPDGTPVENMLAHRDTLSGRS